MRVLRNPVLQFLVVGVVSLLGLVAVADDLARSAAADEARTEAKAINEVLAQLIVRPLLSQTLLDADIGAADAFDRALKLADDLVDSDAVRVIVWRRDGTVVYSTQYDLIGQRFRLTDPQRAALAPGGELSTVEPADSSDAMNATAGDVDDWLRIYTPVKAEEGPRVLFEADYELSDLEQRRQQIYANFRWIAIGGPALLLLLVTPLLHILTRRLTRAGEERERLLRSAIGASDAERRRIARDLHDGVVQDLAGTAYSVTALSRSPQTSDEARRTLDAAAESLRGSLSALRSLLAEIHPPDLHAHGLESALADLLAPAGRDGVHASVSVAGIEDAADDAIALVWRVAQEAVRNTLRHARASTLAVTVRRTDGRLVLEVVDDGLGFDPDDPVPAERYGLRGMRTLVADAGGRLEVVSAPGEGTTVRVEVDAR